MVEGEPDRRRKQSLIERISEQLVPAILTAGVLGVIGFKVMEYKLVELERRSAETSAIVARHTVEITQQQERLAAATERFQAAISSIEKISDRMESRMSNMERR
jgi:hypothetical protein